MSAALQREAEARYPFKTSNGVDHKAWAKRILYRFERNDKDLLICQIKDAQAAMAAETPSDIRY